MKSIFAMFLVSLSLSTYAATSLDEAIKKVETEKNARCEEFRTSTISKCLGTPPTCFYNVFFRCSSVEGDFGLKIKVREIYDWNGRALETTAHKVIITN
jgi:hypothetical protein